MKSLLFHILTFSLIFMFNSDINSQQNFKQKNKSEQKTTKIPKLVPDPQWKGSIKVFPPFDPIVGRTVNISAKLVVKNGSAKNLLVIAGVGSQQTYSKHFNFIGMGEEKNVSFRWKATRAGIHIIKFSIDPYKHHTDNNRDNNIITTNLRVLSTEQLLPDLVLFMGHRPKQTIKGQKVRFTARVRNVGRTASAPCDFNFYIGPSTDQSNPKYNYNSRWQFTRRIPALKPGERNTYVTEDMECFFVYPAVYKYTARVDIRSEVEESNENNNKVVGYHTVIAKPDLRIHTIHTWDPKIGRKHSISVTVENIGDKGAGPFKLELKCRGKPGNKDRSSIIPSLGVGEKVKKTYNYKWWKKGQVKCTAYADTLNQVDEADENNNTSSLYFSVSII